ncbi:MAG: carbohydrate-binding family 9-like protein [Tannerella sp.]|jgi:hypothetical protein|nr:carbohydrate-binding family 9-like protein [Tannerella sp.]
MKSLNLLIFFSLTTMFVNAQSETPFAGLEHLFVQPKSYVVGYTKNPPVIDGDIDEAAWKHAVWTEEFRDIEGTHKALPYYPTKAKMLWDTDYLYIAAELIDKHVWANLTGHDQIVYHDNDFEVFIDPSNDGHNYYEIEINALNTIFDLFLTKPYRSGAGLLISWDCKTMKHAVKIKGTLNNPADEDEGWTVELAIPFKDLESKVEDKSIWRLGFSRVEWNTEVSNGKYVKKTNPEGKNLPENNWVWSPTGRIDMHMPERWAYILFSAQESGSELLPFELPYSEIQKQYLWLVYYRQQEYNRKNHKYSSSLVELGINSLIKINGKINSLSIETTPVQFTVTVSDSINPAIRINNEGLVKNLREKE